MAFRLGQVVSCPVEGVGIVELIWSEESICPLAPRVKFGNSFHTYTADGKYWTRSPIPTLSLVVPNDNLDSPIEVQVNKGSQWRELLFSHYNHLTQKVHVFPLNRSSETAKSTMAVFDYKSPGWLDAQKEKEEEALRRGLSP